MYKHTMKYENFNGEEVTEDLYFNLTLKELTDIIPEIAERFGGSTTAKDAGAVSELLNKIVDSQDTTTMLELFVYLLTRGYGKKSEDGSRFIKSEEIANDFEHSAAFDALFENSFVGGGDDILNIFFGMMPKAFRKDIDKNALMKQTKDKLSDK